MNSRHKHFFKKISENKIILLLNELKEIRYRRILKKRLRVHSNSFEKNVCILLDKGLGDFLLFAPYLDILADHYSKEGKDVFLLCSSYNVKFLTLCNFNFENIIIIDSTNRKSQLFELLGNYYNCFEIFILPTDSISKYACDIIRLLNPIVIYAIGNKIRDFKAFSLSDQRLCLSIITFPGTEEGFYSERHRVFTINLTGKNQPLGLTEIKQDAKNEMIEKGDYYLINIGSSSTSKVWPIEHVVALIRIIAKYSNIKPIIVGNCSDRDQIKIEKSGFDCRYLNLIDLAKTISLCQYSKLIITNDTGLYHLSAALQKSTCVLSAGSYLELFLPYPPQLIFGKIQYIIPDKKCETCNRHLSCFINRKKGKTLECLVGISPQQVSDILIEDNLLGC